MPEQPLTKAAPPKVFLMGASFNTGNMGVSALAVGSITCILHGLPEAKISLLGYAKERIAQPVVVRGKELLLPSINMRFSKKFYLPNNIAVLLALALASKLAPSRSLRKKLVRSNAVLRQIDDGDLFACMSGGDSFSDIYGLHRFLIASLPQLLVLLLGKRLVLLPQTLGPYRSRAVRAVARYILRRAEAVYSRDHLGPRNMQALLGPRHAGKVRFSPDVAFVLEPRAPARTDILGLPEPGRSGRPLAGVNVSGLLYIGGYTRDNMFGLKSQYRELIAALVEHLIARKGADVLLIPHVFGTEGESDPPACERVYEALASKYAGRIGLLRGRYDQSEIKHIIGQCDFFVGSRMHACIAALSQHIPAVAIAYSDKFQGVLETVGADSLVADARRMDRAEILELAGKAFDNRAALRRHLQQRIPEVQRAVLRLFEEYAGRRGAKAPLAGADAGADALGDPGQACPSPRPQ
ncbi:MAG TPA: polysaccharide pyruvyl transferase family protein [Terriglobia bacterium]|nr:polysaccharide pyruvyl transferase family protein [Terriglobia bacterium]